MAMCPACNGSGWVYPPNDPAGRMVCRTCRTGRSAPVRAAGGLAVVSLFVVVGVVVAVAVLANAGSWLEPVLNPSAANNPTSGIFGPRDDGYGDDPDAPPADERIEGELDCQEYGTLRARVDAVYPAETELTRGLKRRATAEVTFLRGQEVVIRVDMTGYKGDGFLTFASHEESGEGPREVIPRHLLVSDDEGRAISMLGTVCRGHEDGG